jgi:hypothetical protein
LCCICHYGKIEVSGVVWIIMRRDSNTGCVISGFILCIPNYRFLYRDERNVCERCCFMATCSCTLSPVSLDVHETMQLATSVLGYVAFALSVLNTVWLFIRAGAESKNWVLYSPLAKASLACMIPFILASLMIV